MRRLTMIAALAVAIALPGSALAATTGGSTTESGISVAVTISMVVPATATYAKNVAQTQWETDVILTGITTNNPTGLTISATVSAFTGAATVPTTARKTFNTATGLTPSADVQFGEWTNSSTSKQLASSTVAVSGATATAGHRVLVSSFTAPGSYVSASQYTATTNP